MGGSFILYLAPSARVAESGRVLEATHTVHVSITFLDLQPTSADQEAYGSPVAGSCILGLQACI